MLYVISVCLISSYFPMFRLARNFYLMTITLLLIVVLPLMYNLLDQNPLIWTFYFVCNKTNKVRIIIILQYFLYKYQIIFNGCKYYRSC